ncbi:alpha-2-macroglobulin-like [Bufo bufo]|uniref:alpha-2-macroglobulin-like n=1 Tax=Bufo bufo TaxID=8384 RepID=UPI001ABE407E|nr:alpha-2-macroglobulin-like [Bufo bufo]
MTSKELPYASNFVHRHTETHKVSLKFSEEQSLPGSMVNLHISAHPNSMCSVRAVDKSGKLLKSEERRSEDNVNQFLKEWDTEGYPIEIEELQECPLGSSPVFVEASEQPDIFSLFEHCGIKTLTNFAIRKPLECELQGPEILQNFAKSKMVFPGVKKDAPPQENVRRRSPTTWIMNLMLIGSTGELDYPVKTPDTITQWNVEAFCTSTIGLGFSPQTYLQVFKPFSLEMITPYSVKQGETFVLKANVLNSMRRCMKVQATLYQSKDFQVEPCEGCLYNACLCSKPTYTFTWNIISLTLGSINISVSIEALSTNDLCDGQKPMVPKRVQSDIVQRRLIIEQNGVPEKKTHSILLCAFELDTILLDLPENVVLGSQSAKVTVTGDIMGKPLDNLNNLVLLPFGCGEQNMMLLGPMIAVINYYSTTGQLTDEIVAKATEFMETGLQNQLNYKHTDGSYSAFGNSDPSGSTWLTAFVARIFFMGLKYIHIEYRHITEALDWLKGQQRSNGCFKSVGQIFPKERQVREDNMITLTAFVSLTFLEVGDPQYDEVIEKSKRCLEKCTDAQSSTYTKAQCAYAYTLMGDTEKRTRLLEQLDQVAIKKDDMTQWSQNSEIPSDDPLRSKPNSGNVETTAYVVLAMVSGTNPTKTDLGAAVPAIRWLNSQQNSNGGFITTQDTVVAIFAMSKYGSLTFVYENMPTVTITNDKGFSENVTVNPQNPTEVKVVDLPDIPAEYTLEASGSGCAYVQIIIGYNILNPEPEKSFMLDAVTSAIECPPHPAPKFSIGISFSLSDAREDEASNMAIIIVKMVSGFVPVKRSVNALLANSVVKKVKSSPADVTIYLEKK